MLKILSLIVFLLSPFEVLAQENGGFFDSNGVKIRYFDQGDGEPVVVIKFRGNNSSEPSAKLIEAGYRVVTVHQRGFGESDKPHDASQYGLEMSHDIARLLDHLKIAKAHVIGSSMCALVTNRLRASHPTRLLSATLVAGGPLNERSVWVGRANEFADAISQGNYGPMRLYLRSVENPRPTQEEIAAASENRGPNPVMAAAVRAQGFADSDEELRLNKVPTLLVVGELDPNKKDHVDKAASIMTNSELYVIPGQGHGGIMGHPDFLKSLLPFLKKNTLK